MELAPGRPELIREVNVRRLLRLLQMHGPCSQADLARISKLSPPTVSFAVADLVKKDLVESVGSGRSNGGGRPPKMLRFNAEFGYVAGAEITPWEIRLALADLSGTVLGRWTGPMTSHNTPKRTADLVASGVRELMAQRGIPPQKLLSLAAGIHGIVDARTGSTFSLPHFSSAWRHAPLRGLLEASVKVSTAVENEVNLAAVAESWIGRARGVRNFVFIAVGDGVGAGIFINGRLYRGSGYASGEIGYFYVPGSRETPLQKHQLGPLEEIASTAGIERSWREMLAQRNSSRGTQAANATAGEILRLAREGNREARLLVQHTAKAFACAVANVCAVLDCPLVVVGGCIGSDRVFFEEVRRRLDRNDYPRPQLVLSTLGEEASLLGAVWLALSSAERIVLRSSLGASHSPTDGSNVLQPFLGLASRKQFKLHPSA
jgi:glucokinase